MSFPLPSQGRRPQAQRRRREWAAGIAAVLAFAAASAARPGEANAPTAPPFPPPPESIAGAVTYYYKERAGHRLPIYVFQPAQAAESEPRAAIVFFHGSGWQAGSVLQFADYARLLAAHGLVAAVAEYRVEQRYRATPFDAVADAKSVIRWLRAQAGELGIDERKIVAAGASAGAHIALSAIGSESILDALGWGQNLNRASSCAPLIPAFDQFVPESGRPGDKLDEILAVRMLEVTAGSLEA